LPGVDLGRLSTPDRLTIGAASVLLLATFMPWFEIDVFGTSTDVTGWEIGWFWGRLPLLIAVLLAAHVLVRTYAAQITLPELPWTRVHLIGGSVAGGLIVLRLLFGYEVRGFDFHRTFGIFVALVAALGLTAAGVLRHRASATEQA
jgi:hypothetical protein